jgi:hypothetical protein
VIAAVEANDLSLLVHSGLYSVQLQTAGQPNSRFEADAGFHKWRFHEWRNGHLTGTQLGRR